MAIIVKKSEADEAAVRRRRAVGKRSMRMSAGLLTKTGERRDGTTREGSHIRREKSSLAALRHREGFFSGPARACRRFFVSVFLFDATETVLGDYRRAGFVALKFIAPFSVGTTVVLSSPLYARNVPFSVIPFVRDSSR